MLEKHYMLNDDDYGYVFSYFLNNDVRVQTDPVADIFKGIAKELTITGMVEVYVHDGYLHVDLPLPNVMTSRVIEDSDDGPRIFRIGFGLNIQNKENLKEKIKGLLAGRFSKLITGIEHRPELSEAAIVGSIRASLNPYLFAEFNKGEVEQITSISY